MAFLPYKCLTFLQPDAQRGAASRETDKVSALHLVVNSATAGGYDNKLGLQPVGIGKPLKSSVNGSGIIRFI